MDSIHGSTYLGFNILRVSKKLQYEDWNFETQGIKYMIIIDDVYSYFNIWSSLIFLFSNICSL